MNTTAYLIAAGDNLSFRNVIFPKEYIVKSRNEPNGREEVSRDLGRNHEVGQCRIEILSGDNQNYFFSSANLAQLKSMASFVNLLKKSGADDIYIHLDFEHDGQCNVEIPLEWVKAFADLNIPMTFTTYESDVN